MQGPVGSTRVRWRVNGWIPILHQRRLEFESRGEIGRDARANPGLGGGHFTRVRGWQRGNFTGAFQSPCRRILRVAGLHAQSISGVDMGKSTGFRQLANLAAVALMWLVGTRAAAAASPQPLLLRYPTMSKTEIAFEYGGELWEVPRAGGAAHVLASGMDMLTMPFFSPDGSMIAFTGTYDGNTDVYVVSATGGVPKRLTYYPGPDVAVGWTPDGRSVLFRSHRYSYSDPDQLYTVPISGGFPQELPLPMAEEGSFSRGGRHLAYVPEFQWEAFWKDYKGGQHTQVWLARLSDSSVIRIPDDNANNFDPMWVGNTVYFLSDRDGPITLFAYDTHTGAVDREINNTGFDITSASAGPGGIVYSQFGQLHVFDFARGASRAVPVTVAGDLPQLRPRYENVSKQIVRSSISPHGLRTIFEAHGDLLSVPSKHGSVFDLTHSPDVMDRDPAYSPDGRSVAYFADHDHEYDLCIRAANGDGSPRIIALGQPDAFYYGLAWSPDSHKLVFGDQKLDLWLVNLESHRPHPVRIAINRNATLQHFHPAWSPDSRWIAYTRILRNGLHAVELYSLASGHSVQVTHGSSDVRSPAFDPSGQYLYFTESTNTGLTPGLWEMSGMDRPVTRHVYAATLRNDEPSPLAPDAGFEVPAGKAARTARRTLVPPAVRIDPAGLERRAVALPIPAGRYTRITASSPGTLILQQTPRVIMPGDTRPWGTPVRVLAFDLAHRKVQPLLADVTNVQVAADGKQILFRRGMHWFIAKTTPKAKPQPLHTSALRVYVVPREEWAEMYRDAWRIERAFFYNPRYDGLDVHAAEAEFAHYLPGLASRSELSFLFREMTGYLSVGHMFIYGGYHPRMADIKVGLLGANYAIEHGRYRITRIFRGGRWNPDAYAPLAQPGLAVKTGDYLLAVDGQALGGHENLYRAFENLAGKDVTLRVAPHADGRGAHTIVVKTIPSERLLRNIAWIDHNRALVNRLSGGKLGYVYLPDTGWGGYRNFNRMYFSQVDKQGVILDERFNHGGDISDYIIQNLLDRPMSLVVTRWAPAQVTPPMAIYGPKVMLINQFSGSGGDALPWYFKMDHIGTLVGERTWGGLVGIGGYPRLMDGGGITAPRVAVEGLDGHFPVENHGVAPDVTVWQDPALVRKGQDPQLQRAVQVAMQQLAAHPQPHYVPAPWRDYHPHLPPLPSPTSVGN